jgi:hypothetical protein
MITLRISKKVQWALFMLISISLLTGWLFFALKTWFLVEGEFGLEKHPWQFPVLKIHAASAFLIMLLYGALWGSHVQFGWRSQRSRRSGTVMTSLIGLQVITAYLLYYLSDESMREFIEYLHLAIGTALPLGLITHIVFGRRYKKS